MLNAGVIGLPFGAFASGMEPQLQVNLLGHALLHELLRPALEASPDSRVVVVASGFGTLASLPPALHPHFLDPAPDAAAVDRIMSDYVTAAEAGTDAAEGWPEWVNAPSKVGQVALMRAVAAEIRAEAEVRDILVNAVCPGWTVTDATRVYLERDPRLIAKQPDEAAEDVIWLATLPPGTRAPYGELVRYRGILPFVPKPKPDAGLKG